MYHYKLKADRLSIWNGYNWQLEFSLIEWWNVNSDTES